MIYIAVLCCSSHFSAMQPWFWFVCFVIDWAGRSFLTSLLFCIMSEYITRELLLQVEDFDVSAGVPVSYFYSRAKTCKLTAGSRCNWSVSGKVTVYP